jgi:hypothetical protein
VTVIVFATGARTAVDEARATRLPEGLVECASWLGEQVGDERLLTAERHAMVIIHSALPYSQIDVLPAQAPEPMQSAALVEVMREQRVRWLLAFPGHLASESDEDLGLGLRVRRRCGELRALELSAGGADAAP